MSKCMDPVLCYNGSSRKFRHFSLSSPLFKALHQQVFNCGKCVFCRKRRAAELAVRCVLHSSLYKQNSFLTLTYDESREGYHNVFNYSDIQDFKKRLRSHFSYHFSRKVQLFNVHEYGRNGKKHWHLVAFNVDFPDKRLFTVSSGNSLYSSSLLERLWSHGFCTIGDVSEASAMYQAQYVQKDLKNGNSANDRKSHSKHSGIGRDWFFNNYRQVLRLGFIPFNNRKVPVPRYFLKLADKHYSYFHEPSKFFPTSERERIYTPFDFRRDWPTREIADLFEVFTDSRREFLADISSEWDAYVSDNLFNKEDPDFVKSGSNFLYDFNNKIGLDKF